MNNRSLTSLRALGAALFTIATVGAAFSEDVYVEYVQSDRTKNHTVNVGYKPNPRTKIVVDYAFVDTATVQQRVFGITGEPGSAAVQHYINGANNIAYTCYNDANAGWWALTDSSSKQVKVTTDRRTFILDIPSRYASVWQGATFLCSHTHSVQVTNTTKRTLAIFGNKTANDTLTSNDNRGSLKFYSMQIYESGQIVMDLWPCKSDGKYCIKDRLTGNKFFDVGGKDLAGGAEVAPPAADVLIAPGCNVTTNVPAFGGSVNVQLNRDAADGGIVRMSPNNWYSGTTTLAGGRLEVDNLTAASMGSLGIGGELHLDAATFKYTGGKGEFTRPVVIERNTPSAARRATVFDITGDLTLSGTFTNEVGGFVKTGPGTLRIPGASGRTTMICQKGGSNRLTLPDFGSNGIPGDNTSTFTIFDGTLALGEGGGTFKIIRDAQDVFIGRTTVDPLNPQGRQETDAVLEIYGGTVEVTGWLMVGVKNGFTTTSPLRRPEAGIRMYGGTLKALTAFAMGRNANGGLPYLDENGNKLKQNTSTFLEIYGGTMQVWADGGGSTARCALCDDAGNNSRVFITNGGKLWVVCKGEKGVGEVKSGGAMSVAATADGDLSLHRTADVLVCSNGIWDVTSFYIAGSKSNVTANVKIFDGGVYRNNSLFKNTTMANTSMNILFDGGIAEIRYAGHSNYIKSDVTKAEIGTRGLSFRLGSDANSANAMLNINKTFTAADTHPGEEAQGVSFYPNPKRTSAANGSGFRFTVPQSWAGPTRIGDTGVFELGGTGTFPATSAVTMEPGASLTLTGVSQTFASLTLGAEGKSGVVKIGLLKNLSITANAFALLPGASVAFSLFETATNAVEFATSGDPLTTAGTYTLLTVPAASASDLETLARGATVANAADGTYYKFGVTTSGGTASLTVTVSATASTDIAAASGETETVTSPITGDYVLRTNPTESGAGTVNLGDSLAGFEGSLVSGSGTTEISDLSFVGGALDWVIGPGTLWYTGAATEVPGLTIDSGASGHCGELKIDDDVTILSAATLSGAMCKSGAGDLILKGNGYFQLGKVSTGWSVNGTGNVPKPNGDGRTTGFGALNVSDGRIVVGTVNDPADAPTVESANLLDISPRTTETAGTPETFGEFVMNNGLLKLANGINIGYYNGLPATTPEGTTRHPKLTLNGGTINATHVTMGVDATGQQTCSPELEVNGGELTLSGNIIVGYQGTSSASATNKVEVNDGTVSCGNVTMGYSNDANGTAPGRFEINGGEVRCAANNNFTVGNKSISGRQELYLNGGKLTCFNLVHTGATNSTDVGSGAVYFRGGVLKPGYGRGFNKGLDIGHSSDPGKRMELYVGAAGAKFDLTDWFAGGEDGGLINVYNKFLHDPDCEGADGGLWFDGKGTVIIRSAADGSTFTGPIRATGGVMIGQEDGSKDSRKWTYIIEEGSGLRASSIVMSINHITLGTAGGTKPVLLDFCANRSQVGLIVSNELAILSPVTVSFHTPGGACNTVGAQIGSWGILYYPPELDSQVDLSKFVSNPKLPGVTMTFTKEDSDYADRAAGMRMVKVTITAAASTVGTTWTGAASDGQWMTGGNWNGSEAPNGRDAMAVFPAAHAGTSVAVGGDVTVGRLALYGGDGTGYTFTGTPKFEHTDFKTAPGIVAESGTHVFADGIATDDVFGRGNETVASGNRTGAIEIKAKTGSRVAINGQVKADTHYPLYINNPTSGGGTTVLNADVNMAEVKVQSGTLEMSDLSHLEGKTLTVGPGTFHYTGPAAVSSAKIVTNPGANSAAIASIMRIDDELTLTEKFDSQNASLMKSGPGTIIFAQNTDASITNRIGYGGANTDWNKTGADWYWPSNGDSLTKQGIGSLCVDEGEVVLAGGPDTIFHIANNGTGRDAFIGAQSRGWNYTTHKSALTIYSGTVKAPWVYLGHTFNHGKDASGHLIPTYAEYNQYGGNVSFSTLCFCYDLSDYDTACQATANIYGGTLNVSGVMRFGQTYNKTGVNPPHATFNMYGGVYNHTDTAGTKGTRMGYLGDKAGGQKTLNRACDATLNLYGGNYNEIERIHMGCNATTSRLNLHGGVLKAENIFLNTSTGGNYCFFAGGQAYLYWNGGTYAPVGTTAANQTLGGLTEALVSTNGAFVTTAQLAGESYTIAQPLLHDPALAGKDGGLVKTGAKPLALTGANTYNGDTYVAEGQLVIPADAAATALPPDSAVVVAPGAVLVMANGTAAGIGALAIDMTKTYGTITGLTPARGGTLHLTNVGNGSLLGLELPITLSGNARRRGFSSWKLYVDGQEVEGLVPNVSDGKLVLGLPYGAMLIFR